ncbi:P-loop containing nucleoside triphosphate hydrolase protein [Aspergillus egyptiacus]|nr:P-loop containing nucleoside triphosphate hydrolase protein [Aspergillus egyptiacus]
MATTIENNQAGPEAPPRLVLGAQVPENLSGLFNDSAPPATNVEVHHKAEPKNPKPQDDNNKLLELYPRNSDESKRFMGGHWRYGQLVVAEKRSGQNIFAPANWMHKTQGAYLRVKLYGGSVCPKLMVEVSYNHPDPTQVHKGYLLFDLPTDVEQGSCVVLDNTYLPRKKSGRSWTDAENRERERSHYAISFLTYGGTGFYLDKQSTTWDTDTSNTFDVCRLMCKDYTTYSTPIFVAVQINVCQVNEALGLPGVGSSQDRRSLKEFELTKDLVYAFRDRANQENRPHQYSFYRSAMGRPLTQWNSMAERKAVHDNDKPIQYPSQTGFSNVKEAAIILANGANLEHQREFEYYLNLAKFEHKIGFVHIANGSILVIVRFQKPEDVDIPEQFRIREQSVAKIAFKHPTRDQASNDDDNISAVSIPNFYVLKGGQNCTFLVSKKSRNICEDLAVPPGKHMPMYTAHIVVTVPSAGAQRQVDAVNRLCGLTEGPDLSRWHSVLLNKKAGDRTIHDPTEGLDIDASLVATAQQKIIHGLGIEWSDDQKECLLAACKFAERVMIIQGLPGVGKTFLLIALTYFYRKLGLHVLVCTPSHYAADAYCQVLEGFLGVAKNIEDPQIIEPLRVYRESSEYNAYKARTRPTADAFEENLEEDGPNNTANGTQFETVPLPDLPVGEQVMLQELSEAFYKRQQTKHYGLPEKSLRAKVVSEAERGLRVLMGHYSSEEQVELSQELLNMMQYDGDVSRIPLGDEVDMFAELRRFLDKLKESPIHEWEDDERRKCELAFRKCAEAIMEDTGLLVCTNNNAGSNLVASHFGLNAKGIIVIRDEDTKELEVNGWIPVAKLAAADKVTGVILVGDRKQLKPTVLSHQGPPFYNEFSEQMTLSLTERLLRTGHPCLTLSEQRRFRPVFAQWLNQRVYNGIMRSHKSTNLIRVHPGWATMMKTYLSLPPAFDPGYLSISIKGARCFVNPLNKSKFNIEHIDFVVDLIVRNHNAQAYSASDIRIITPYVEQETRYRQKFLELTGKNILPVDGIPAICTADSSQGQESKVVILDWVIAKSDKRGDLGFTAEDNRGNVAQSRMKEVLINIVPMAVGTGASALVDNHQNVPYPCAFVQWATRQRVIVVERKPINSPDIINPLDDFNDNTPAEGDWKPHDAEDSAEGAWKAHDAEDSEYHVATGFQSWDGSRPDVDNADHETILW